MTLILLLSHLGEARVKTSDAKGRNACHGLDPVHLSYNLPVGQFTVIIVKGL